MKTPAFKPGHYYLVDQQVLRAYRLDPGAVVFVDDLNKTTLSLAPDTPHIPVAATRPEKPVLPLVATLLARMALASHGLPRTSTLNGGDLLGLLPPERISTHGFNIRINPDNPQELFWMVTLSGKPHLDYLEEGEDELIPMDPERLYPALTKAFAALGLIVTDCDVSGWQRHWDDDVHYRITTPVPDWLDLSAR